MDGRDSRVEVDDLHLLGLNLRTASLAVREAISFTPQEIRALLRAAASRFPRLEVAILSTRNRTEICLAGPNVGGSLEDWLICVRHARSSESGRRLVPPRV